MTTILFSAPAYNTAPLFTVLCSFCMSPFSFNNVLCIFPNLVPISYLLKIRESIPHFTVLIPVETVPTTLIADSAIDEEPITPAGLIFIPAII